ncbi:MAG: oligosaccharide flippase family protein [Bacteroidales bacterium]|nr:oligosaccharide flippase family protein [Bacteroidales bacterium]
MNSLLSKILSAFHNPTLRNGLLFSLFSFVNKGFFFLLLLIIARFISPYDYGLLSVFGTVIMLVGYFQAMSTEGYLSVAFFKDGVFGVRQVFSGIIVVSLLVSAMLCIVLGIGGSFISVRIDLPLEILFIGILISFFNVYFNLYLDYLRVKSDVFWYGILSCGNAVLNFILTVILVQLLDFGWVGRVYAQGFCTVLVGLIGIVLLLKQNFLSRIDIKYFKKMLLWGIPLIPHLGAIFIRQGGDTYIIKQFYDLTDVGLFNFAYTFTSAITMVGFGFNQSFSVDIYKTLGDKTISESTKLSVLKQQRNFLYRIFIGAAIFISLCVVFVIPLFFEKYVAAVKYFYILSFYGLFVCFYLIYSPYLFFFQETKKIMYITFGSSVLHLLVSLWLTRYSLLLTCVLYVATQFLQFFLVRMLVKRTLKLKLING